MTDNKDRINQLETHMREDLKEIREDIKKLGDKMENGNRYLADVISKTVNLLDGRLRVVEGETKHTTGKIVGCGVGIVFMFTVIQFLFKNFLT